MLNNLKQFVPSNVCLKCDGCCQFKSEDSPWRPKTGAQEGFEASVDEKGYVKAIAACGNHFCQFFNTDNHHCKVYDKRPLECALYPFILSRAGNDVNVFVHLACPYVQDTQSTDLLTDHVSYLKDLLHRADVKDFLKRNKRLLHDYLPFKDELLFLFPIEDFHL